MFLWTLQGTLMALKIWSALSVYLPGFTASSLSLVVGVDSESNALFYLVISSSLLRPLMLN
jgi:hypothetical protein